MGDFPQELLGRLLAGPVPRADIAVSPWHEGQRINDTKHTGTADAATACDRQRSGRLPDKSSKLRDRTIACAIVSAPGETLPNCTSLYIQSHDLQFLS